MPLAPYRGTSFGWLQERGQQGTGLGQRTTKEDKEKLRAFQLAANEGALQARVSDAEIKQALEELEMKKRQALIDEEAQRQDMLLKRNQQDLVAQELQLQQDVERSRDYERRSNVDLNRGKLSNDRQRVRNETARTRLSRDEFEDIKGLERAKHERDVANDPIEQKYKRDALRQRTAYETPGLLDMSAREARGYVPMGEGYADSGMDPQNDALWQMRQNEELGNRFADIRDYMSNNEFKDEAQPFVREIKQLLNAADSMRGRERPDVLNQVMGQAIKRFDEVGLDRLAKPQLSTEEAFGQDVYQIPGTDSVAARDPKTGAWKISSINRQDAEAQDTSGIELGSTNPNEDYMPVDQWHAQLSEKDRLALNDKVQSMWEQEWGMKNPDNEGAPPPMPPEWKYDKIEEIYSEPFRARKYWQSKREKDLGVPKSKKTYYPDFDPTVPSRALLDPDRVEDPALAQEVRYQNAPDNMRVKMPGDPSRVQQAIEPGVTPDKRAKDEVREMLLQNNGVEPSEAEVDDAVAQVQSDKLDEYIQNYTNQVRADVPEVDYIEKAMSEKHGMEIPFGKMVDNQAFTEMLNMGIKDPVKKLAPVISRALGTGEKNYNLMTMMERKTMDAGFPLVVDPVKAKKEGKLPKFYRDVYGRFHHYTKDEPKKQPRQIATPAGVIYQ